MHGDLKAMNVFLPAAPDGSVDVTRPGFEWCGSGVLRSVSGVGGRVRSQLRPVCLQWRGVRKRASVMRGPSRWLRWRLPQG
eukprot:2688822-Rhodomonas_salina.2